MISSPSALFLLESSSAIAALCSLPSLVRSSSFRLSFSSRSCLARRSSALRSRRRRPASSHRDAYAPTTPRRTSTSRPLRARSAVRIVRPSCAIASPCYLPLPSTLHRSRPSCTAGQSGGSRASHSLGVGRRHAPSAMRLTIRAAAAAAFEGMLDIGDAGKPRDMRPARNVGRDSTLQCFRSICTLSSSGGGRGRTRQRSWRAAASRRMGSEGIRCLCA